MKKFLASLFVSALVAAGLFVASESATADPYPGSIATTCRVKAKAKVDQGKKNLIQGQADVPGSKKKPKGTVTVKLKRVQDGAVYATVTYPDYKGKVIKFNTVPLNKTGEYKVIFKYKPKSGSVFKKCKATRTFKVK